MGTYNTAGSGGQPDSQAIYPVTEAGPGVEVGYLADQGAPAHLVGEMGPGVKAVQFVNWNGAPEYPIQAMMFDDDAQAADNDDLDCFILLLS